MELRELRYFVAVAEERSFSRAAGRLHLAQQSLSAAIAKLEAQLGCALLVRTTRRVEVTPAGRALLEAAPGVLAAADGALAAARRAGEMRADALRVRYGLDSGHLAEPLLLALAAAHPGLDLRTAVGVDAENLDAVREGRADAAFAWALDGREGDLSRTRVGAEECLLAMPAGHPLARADVVARTALAGHTVVMFPRAPTPAVWDAIADALGLAGTPERVHVLPVNGQEAMVETALALGAVCPVSAGLAAGLTSGRPSAVVRRLEPPVHIPLHLAWRHPAAVAVHALAETARPAGARPSYSAPPSASNGPQIA